MPTAELLFRAMGTAAHVHVVAPCHADALAQLARERIELLEDCWSRFRPASELNRLNDRAGCGPVPVSNELLVLVGAMVDGWLLSDGRFDPTVLTSMHALGYDADYATVVARNAVEQALVATQPTAGMQAVVVDRSRSEVGLPFGVGLDPGAIGKGLAADLVVADLMAAGSTGALVNLGGDLSVAGTTVDGAPWTIAVEDERRAADHPDRVIRTVSVDGPGPHGIATSTTLTRRWADGRRHHVIDPRTGRPADAQILQATVVAASAAEAEVAATTAVLSEVGHARRWLAGRGLRSLLLTADDDFDALDGAESTSAEVLR